MLVPCGKCIQCLQERKDAWCYRLFLESQTSKHSYFVTLTYDNASLPLRKHSDDSFVRYIDYIKYKSIEFVSESLYPKDLTDYWKRVRKALPDKSIKYYACGEYGDKDGRPHYHFVLFNSDCDAPFLESVIDDKWQFGFVKIEPLIYPYIEYVTKYITENVNFTAVEPHQVEYFQRQSHGLGLEGYFSDVKYFGSNYKTTMLPSGKVITTPRYFRKKFYPNLEYNYYNEFKSQQAIYKNAEKLRSRIEQDAKIILGNPTPSELSKYIDDKLNPERRESVSRRNIERRKQFRANAL